MKRPRDEDSSSSTAVKKWICLDDSSTSTIVTPNINAEEQCLEFLNWITIDKNSNEKHYCEQEYCLCGPFPSKYLLDLHLQEKHDSLFFAMVNRAYKTKTKVFCCLMENCEDKFISCHARQQHMSVKHLGDKGKNFFYNLRNDRKFLSDKYNSNKAYNQPESHLYFYYPFACPKVKKKKTNDNKNEKPKSEKDNNNNNNN